jgi:predicted metal-dependent phosphotriesterase family hydrolase
MLSHDWNVKNMAANDPTSSMGESNPDGYLWISRGVLPYLRELGVSDRAVNALMVENPRRFFEGTGQ